MAACPACKEELKQETYGYHCRNPKCDLFGQVRATPELPIEEKSPTVNNANFADPRVAELASRVAWLEDAVQGLHEQMTTSSSKSPKK